MSSSSMFRFQVKVPNVYAYAGDIDSRCNISELASYKNEVSGWVKQENVEHARKKFSGLPMRFIPADEYWSKYDQYQKGDWASAPLPGDSELWMRLQFNVCGSCLMP